MPTFYNYDKQILAAKTRKTTADFLAHAILLKNVAVALDNDTPRASTRNKHSFSTSMRGHVAGQMNIGYVISFIKADDALHVLLYAQVRCNLSLSWCSPCRVLQHDEEVLRCRIFISGRRWRDLMRRGRSHFRAQQAGKMFLCLYTYIIDILLSFPKMKGIRINTAMKPTDQRCKGLIDHV